METHSSTHFRPQLRRRSTTQVDGRVAVIAYRRCSDINAAPTSLAKVPLTPTDRARTRKLGLPGFDVFQTPSDRAAAYPDGRWKASLADRRIDRGSTQGGLPHDLRQTQKHDNPRHPCCLTRAVMSPCPVLPLVSALFGCHPMGCAVSQAVSARRSAVLPDGTLTDPVRPQ